MPEAKCQMNECLSNSQFLELLSQSDCSEPLWLPSSFWILPFPMTGELLQLTQVVLSAEQVSWDRSKRMLHSTVQNQGEPWPVARSWNTNFGCPVKSLSFSPSVSVSLSLSLSRSIRIQARSCHPSGFPTLLELKGPVGKKMYNHWIRWYHHLCAPWSRVGFPHLKDHTVVWHFSGFVANSSFPPFFGGSGGDGFSQ